MGDTDRPMRRRASAASNLAADLAPLPHRSYAELQAEWRRLYRAHPPKKLSRDVLELAVAWKLQEAALGGLSATAKRQLEALAQSMATGGDIAQPRAVSLKPGARLVREWNGETHDVLVVKNGFRWREKTWTSLSAVAREITGTRWSGPRFFGLPDGTGVAPARRPQPEVLEAANG